MKVATLSTLWDYINRAMPWTQPKSLTTEEVYAVTAFMLNLGGIVPDDFTLSDKNIREVQARMPNRNGMTTAHALWPGTGLPGQAAKPDTNNTACMSNCVVEAKVTSLLPEFARDAHGNLSEQNRTVGAQRGADTTRSAAVAQATASPAPATVPAIAKPAPASPAAAPVAAGAAAEPKPSGAAARALAQKNSCTACHGATQKIVGPSFAEIARKYPGKVDYLAGKIVAGGSGVWGPIPMPPQALNPADARTLANWLATGAAQ
jgi:cytochrome c